MSKVMKGTIEVLENALLGARNGEVRDVYLVYKGEDEEYYALYNTEDVNDMLYGVRTCAIQTRQGVGMVETAIGGKK